MSPLFLALPCAAWWLPLATTAARPAPNRATAPAAYFTDSDRLLSADPAFARECHARLAAFATRTGVKLHLQLRATFAPTTPAQRPGTRTGLIADESHLDDGSILAVYFADRDRWGLWIGDALLPRLMGRPGDAQVFTRDGSLHRAKQDLITTALTRAAARSAAAGKIPAQVKAMLAVLIEKFSPATAPPAGWPPALSGK
jgi:hypothetical protein